MFNSNLVKEAHKMAKSIKSEFANVDYKLQFGLCMSYLLEGGKEKMVELTGSEKQIAWAEKIRAEQINNLKFAINDYKSKGFLATIIEKMEISLSEIEGQNSAKWWIENKGIARHLVEKAMHREM